MTGDLHAVMPKLFLPEPEIVVWNSVSSLPELAIHPIYPLLLVIIDAELFF